MIDSRNIDDLNADVKNLALKLVSECKKQLNIDLLIISTYRDNEYQNVLFNKIPKVTQARGGESYHNYRAAFDCVPLDINKQPIWSNVPLWEKIGKIGVSLGLGWGGKFSFKDYGHFEKRSPEIDLQIQLAKKKNSVISAASNAVTSSPLLLIIAGVIFFMFYKK